MRTLFICLSFCIASTSYGQSNREESKQGQKHAPRDERGTKKQPLVIQGIPAQRSENEVREEREAKAEQAAIGTRVSRALTGIEEESIATTKLTLGLFMVALFQALMFAIQLWMMRDSMRDARVAAIAARQGARSTKASVQLMENTAERQLRAYMLIRSVEIPALNTPGELRVRMRMKNWGQTPAYKFAWIHSIEIADWPLTEIPEPDEEQKAAITVFGDVAPDASVESIIKRPHISDEDRAAIHAGTKTVALFSYMPYIDAFGKQRLTKSCYIMGGGHHEVRVGEMYAHVLGNEST